MLINVTIYFIRRKTTHDNTIEALFKIRDVWIDHNLP